MNPARALRFICLASLAFLAACEMVMASPTPQPRTSFAPFVLITQDPNASPTPTPFQPSESMGTSVWTWTPVPPATEAQPATSVPEPIVIPTDTALPPTVMVLPPTQSLPPPVNPSRPNYVIYAALDFANRALIADETIRYYNGTGVPLSDIVLSVQPNRWAGVFTLNSVAQDGVAITNFTLEGQRLTLYLPQPVAAGSSTALTVGFALTLPNKGSGLFGYDFNQINLVDWYPFVVPYNGGWILREPVAFGEHLAYESADLEVNIKTDADVIIAASAPEEANGEWRRFRIEGARTFALSASDEFLVTESAVGSTIIRSYYFAGYQAPADSILYSAKQAVSIYAAKFAPYPYQTLAVVEADIHDGQEYDGLVFISSEFYNQYGGGAKNNLTTIGIHEIAHQWWFGLVGNDQALEPWLDEALSAYSEKIFYEYNYPKYGDWWWGFRVDYFGPAGYVDASIYDHATFRAYTNAVYLNGAHFVHDLRVLMGDNDFFAFIKDYAARYSRRIATSQDFFNVAREHTGKDLTYLIAEYFAGSY